MLYVIKWHLRDIFGLSYHTILLKNCVICLNAYDITSVLNSVSTVFLERYTVDLADTTKMILNRYESISLCRPRLETYLQIFFSKFGFARRMSLSLPVVCASREINITLQIYKWVKRSRPNEILHYDRYKTVSINVRCFLEGFEKVMRQKNTSKGTI